tara:strand:+ start:529 stop:660 length:132 start_codon:yes stop_codon:yes gene_type:complete
MDTRITIIVSERLKQKVQMKALLNKKTMTKVITEQLIKWLNEK